MCGNGRNLTEDFHFPGRDDYQDKDSHRTYVPFSSEYELSI